VWEFFEEVALSQPDQVALVEGDQEVTFERLRSDVESLAAMIVARLGEGRHHIGIRAASARTLVTTSLAVARAGMVSVSLDLRDPEKRMAAVCFDAEVKLVVTDNPDAPEGVDVMTIDAADLPEDKLDRPSGAQPDDLSCICYSSGSTGLPKGIMYPHKARVGTMVRARDEGRFMTDNRRGGFPWVGSATNSDMFAITVITGATIVIYPMLQLGLGGLIKWVSDNHVGTLGIVPTIVRHLLATLRPEERLDVDRVVLYGEGSLWPEIVSLLEHMPPDAMVLNGYGTMETAGGTSFEISQTSPVGEGRIPAGWASSGRFVEVLGPNQETLPAGEEGEIAISGSDLPTGYWNKPDLTAQKFRQLPNGHRQFLTGDVGLLSEDGCLEVFGRNDHMVKVNGFKVELPAVERQLMSIPGVSVAAAVPRPDHEGHVRVVAWAVAGGGHSERSLRAELSRLLPGPSVPDRIIIVDELPRLGSGKADRQALARRELPEMASSTYDDELTSQVAALFEQILNRKGVGPDDDFFELGGDSLRAARLISEIEVTCRVSLGVATMLEARSPAALAALIAARTGGSDAAGGGVHPANETNGTNGMRAKNQKVQAPSHLVPVRITGDRSPLIVVHDGACDVMYARGLAQLLGDQQPVYAISGQQQGGRPAVDRTVEEMAARYVADVRKAVPEGPYVIFGFSFGGLIGFEMAQQLVAAGQQVPVVAIGDTAIGDVKPFTPPPPASRLSAIAKKAPSYGLRSGMRRARDVKDEFIERKAQEKKYKRAMRYMETGQTPPLELRPEFAMLDHAAIGITYKIQPYEGDVLLFTSKSVDGARAESWRPLVRGDLKVVPIDQHHTWILKPGGIEILAAALDDQIQAARGGELGAGAAASPAMAKAGA
jgi:acyl-CoA synthetase (AMP-forming)/AMP-acid ligase II/thioesterase domain-containing protein